MITTFLDFNIRLLNVSKIIFLQNSSAEKENQSACPMSKNILYISVKCLLLHGQCTGYLECVSVQSRH